MLKQFGFDILLYGLQKRGCELVPSPATYTFHRDYSLTLYLIETPFKAFANRAYPYQTALVKAAWSGATLFAYRNLILHKLTWQVISLF